MKRATWLRKALWITPLVLLVLIVAAYVAARSYLSSGHATQQVTQHLQDMLGGRVEVQEAKIGLIGDSTVRGIQAFAEGEQDKPWLQVEDVTTDASALSLLREKTPQSIQLQGAHITLQFASDGKLLTKLPKAKKGAPAKLPRLHIENCTMTFDQQHRSPMIIRGINADIESADNGLTLTGTVTDPFWGDWKVQGNFENSAGSGSITLNSDEVDVTMQKLQAIAFVPPSVWTEVHVEGKTPAQVHLDLATGDKKTSVRYRVDVAPRDAHVQVPSIDLDATHASGKAIIADQIVTLQDVHGKTAGGTIHTSGTLNFRDEPTRLAFKVGLQDVVLHDLPRSWKIPRNIDGNLTGSADLVVTIKQGKAQTSGSGEGQITKASFEGFKVSKPIRLSLHSENGRIRFRRPSPASVAQQNSEDRVRAEDTISAEHETALEESEQADAGDLVQNAPVELVNLLGRGIKLTADGLAQGIDATAKALGKIKPPSKPGEQPTYLDIDLNLKDVDVAQLLQRLKLNLPYAVAGRLTIQVHASIPINTAGDLKAYRLRGDAKLPRFSIAGLELTVVVARVRYANGILNLEELRGHMPRANDPKTVGTIAGHAREQVVPQGDLQANLKLDQIPLDQVLSLVPEMKKQATGVLSGNVEARAPMATLSDPATWRGTANLTSPRLEIYGLPVRNLSAKLNVEQARATLADFKADVEGTPLTGEGELQLKGSYPFKSEMHLGRTDLAALNRLTPSFRPPIEIKGRAKLGGTLKGTLKPIHFDSTGKVQASDLVAEGFKVDELSFDWSKDDKRLKLEAINAELYGGSVKGSALVPLDASATASAKLRLCDLDVQAVAKSLPKFPVRLEGKVSGTVNGELKPGKKDQPRAWTTDVELTAPMLRVQGVPTEKLKGKIDSHDGKTSYRLEGESLGGTFTMKGDLPASAKEKAKQKEEPPLGEVKQQNDEPMGRGQIEVRNASLTRLWAAYNITGVLAHLDGRFSIFLSYKHTWPSFLPVGNGTFRIVNVSWYDEYLGNSLQGEARLTANFFELSNITGDIGGGLFLGRFAFGLKANSRSAFHIDLQQVEASRLFAPLPDVAAHVKGPVDLNIRGRMGQQEWDGSGGATLVRGQVYSLDVTEWRLPLSFSFSPQQGTGELSIRDSTATIAQGRARFESTLHWNSGLDLTGLLLFFQVDLRTLLRNSPSLSSYASGRVSGRIDLAGREMHSANDLTAIVHAHLKQGQALQMPVLRHITPYLRPGISSATFQSGDLKGRLAGGIFRIQRLALVGDFLKLLIQGSITLAGNLDLDVIAQTGLYCLNPAKQNALNSRIPLVGAIPRLVLYEATALLANQVVHLHVTGTVRSPVVRVEPILQLTEEAVRFFLGRLTGLGVSNMP